MTVHVVGPWRMAMVVAAAMLCALWVGAAPPAWAACHAFEVKAEPGNVAEGSSVKVTISRDANVAPSNIDVETIDGTAGGDDYAGVARRTVSFSNETEQSFDIATVDDSASESAETFRVHLSNPGGCAVNTNYVVGPDATVSITDNDAAPTTAPPTTDAPSSTATPSTSDTTAGTTSSSTDASSTSTTVSTSTTELGSTVQTTGSASAASDSDGSNGAWAAVAGVAVLAAAGGAVALILRRRARDDR